VSALVAIHAKEPVLRDTAGQEVTECRFDERRQRVATSLGFGEETVQFGSDDTVDQLLVGASRLMGVRGTEGTDRQHAPRCPQQPEQVNDADGVNADRGSTAATLGRRRIAPPGQVGR